jgi:hypothetical protein
VLNKIFIYLLFLRFSPSFFLYIATIIPPTWFLELENIKNKRLAMEIIANATAHSQNQHSSSPKPVSSNHTNDNSTEQIYDINAAAENIVPMSLLTGEMKVRIHL